MLEVSESSCARKLRDQKQSLFNAFEIFDHMGLRMCAARAWAGFPYFLYVLFIGNLTTPIMNRLAPLSSRLRFPWDWIAYLILLFLTAVAIASLTVAIVMPVYIESNAVTGKVPVRGCPAHDLYRGLARCLRL
jgi:hypothetical protein